MTILIPAALFAAIHAHGESSYPEEGAGFLLGKLSAGIKYVKAILPLDNAREISARHNRYLLSAADYMRAELEAARHGLDVVGVFHSHPDHPNQPSEFDQEWAMPWFSYIITSILHGKTEGSRSWLLHEDRTGFVEEAIKVDGQDH